MVSKVTIIADMLVVAFTTAGVHGPSLARVFSTTVVKWRRSTRMYNNRQETNTIGVNV